MLTRECLDTVTGLVGIIKTRFRDCYNVDAPDEKFDMWYISFPGRPGVRVRESEIGEGKRYELLPERNLI